jgi:hypothetical protein
LKSKENTKKLKNQFKSFSFGEYGAGFMIFVGEKRVFGL